MNAIKVKVNGTEKEFDSPVTLAELVESLGLHRKSVFIEYNREPLDRKLYAETRIREGDNIEIVTMMAGG